MRMIHEFAEDVSISFHAEMQACIVAHRIVAFQSIGQCPVHIDQTRSVMYSKRAARNKWYPRQIIFDSVSSAAAGHDFETISLNKRLWSGRTIYSYPEALWLGFRYRSP